MIIVNLVGVVLFMSILFDCKIIFEEYFVMFLCCVLNIVECFVGIFVAGFNLENVNKIVWIVYE